jgi:hypothetical protein
MKDLFCRQRGDNHINAGSSWRIRVESSSVLTLSQYKLLERVSHGEYSNAATVPDEMNDLVAHGYVEKTPTVLFPVMPSRHNYHLTALGGEILQKPRPI